MTKQQTIFPEDYNLEEFNVSARDMAKSHGTTSGTIHNWTKRGAFLYIKRGHRPFYHPSNKTLTGGTIKDNMKKHRFASPLFVIEADPAKKEKKKKKEGAPASTSLTDLTNAVDRLEKSMGAIVKRQERALAALEDVIKMVERVDTRLQALLDNETVTYDYSTPDEVSNYLGAAHE